MAENKQYLGHAGLEALIGIIKPLITDLTTKVGDYTSLGTGYENITGAIGKLKEALDKTAADDTVTEIQDKLETLEQAIGTWSDSGTIAEAIAELQSDVEALEKIVGAGVVHSVEVEDNIEEGDTVKITIDGDGEEIDFSKYVNPTDYITSIGNTIDSDTKKVTLKLYQGDDIQNPVDVDIDLSSMFDEWETTDRFLENVELEGNNLVFTFNTTGDEGKDEKTEITVDISRYFNVYSHENAEGAEVEVKVDGYKISAALSAAFKAKVSTLEGKVDTLEKAGYQNEAAVNKKIEEALEDYAKSEDLEDYVKTTTLTSTLESYAKTDDLPKELTASEVQAMWND